MPAVSVTSMNKVYSDAMNPARYAFGNTFHLEMDEQLARPARVRKSSKGRLVRDAIDEVNLPESCLWHYSKSVPSRLAQSLRAYRNLITDTTLVSSLTM